MPDDKPNLLQRGKAEAAEDARVMREASSVMLRAGARITELEQRAQDAIAALQDMVDGGSECAAEDTRIGAVIRTLEGEKP